MQIQSSVISIFEKMKEKKKEEYKNIWNQS